MPRIFQVLAPIVPRSGSPLSPGQTGMRSHSVQEVDGDKGCDRVGRANEDCRFSEAGAGSSQQKQERKWLFYNHVAGSALRL